jgi:hypothetical protein
MTEEFASKRELITPNWWHDAVRSLEGNFYDPETFFSFEKTSENMIHYSFVSATGSGSGFFPGIYVVTDLKKNLGMNWVDLMRPIGDELNDLFSNHFPRPDILTKAIYMKIYEQPDEDTTIFFVKTSN